MALLPATAHAAELVDCGYCGGEGDGTNLTWTLDSDGVITISGSGAMADYEPYNSQPWEDYLTSMTAAVIEDGVTSIGDCAFARSRIESVRIPQGVIRIGESAFAACSKLLAVTLPDSVSNIESGAFSQCIELTAMEIPNAVTSIERQTFYYCEKLRSIKLPNRLTSIGYRAFYGCLELRDLDIPETVRHIDDGAFRSCTALTELILPSGVVSIGDYCFDSCTRLTSITIPDSLTSMGETPFSYTVELNNIIVDESNPVYSSRDGVLFNKNQTVLLRYPGGRAGSYVIPNGVEEIGAYAFEYCINITGVTLSSSVIQIGAHAFADCQRLTSLTFSGVGGSIGDHAFTGCHNLVSLSIPNGVTQIGPGAFSRCSRMTHIQLPDALTAIETGLFYYCSALTEVVIPDRVTSIGENAFQWCKALKSVTIPNSVAVIEPRAFGDCQSLSAIELPNRLTSIDVCTFAGCLSLAVMSVPRSLKKVADGAFSRCDSLSHIYYAGKEADWLNIRVESSNDAFKAASVQCEQGGSSSTSVGAPVIRSGLITAGGKACDLFDQAVNVEAESKDPISLHVSVDPNGCSAVDIHLTQGVDKSIQLENNSIMALHLGELFEVGKDIYVLAVDRETGRSSSKKTRLRIVNPAPAEWSWGPGESVPEGFNFKLGGHTGLTIPKDVPVFGGVEVNWDFDFFPISVEHDREDDHKINVVFGTTIASETIEKNENGKTYQRSVFQDFDFEQYKADLKEAAEWSVSDLRYLRKLYSMSELKKMSFFRGMALAGGQGEKSNDLNVAGYAEMRFVDGSWVFSEGQLVIDVALKYQYQGQAFIWVVPLYYEFDGLLGAGLEGDMIDISRETFAPIFDGFLTAKAGGAIGGGIGIAKVATVGASGAATFNLKKSLKHEYLKAWIDGEAKFSVKLFGKEVAKKTFQKGSYLIYETGNSHGLVESDAILMRSMRNPVAEIDVNAIYPNESRAYAENATIWAADQNRPILRSVMYSNKNQRLLAKNVYAETAPQLCHLDGTTIMIMQWDNRERADIDRTMLVYSVYNKEADTWSVPAAVCDDGTADFSPCFRDGYLVWQNQKTQMNDEMTLTDIAALGEICVSKWNGNRFDPPITLTDNDALEAQPCISVNGEDVRVIWTTNTENNILGTGGSNGIIESDMNGNVLTEKTGLNAITSISSGFADGVHVIAYVEDEDNRFETIQDRDIRILKNGVETKLTDNSILDSSPVIVNDLIYYYSDSNIVYSSIDGDHRGTVFDEPMTGITDCFAVDVNSSNHAAVWWTKSDDNGTNVYTAFHDGDVWNSNIAISAMNGQNKYANGMLRDDGSMLVAFNCGRLEEDEIIENDLYIVELTPSYDIAITDAFIDEDAMTVYATVENVGELPVESFVLTLLDAGLENHSHSHMETLKPNECAMIALKYNAPVELAYHSVSVSVDISSEEFNLLNNSAELFVGNADLLVESLELVESSEYTFTAKLSNIGYRDAEHVTISLVEDSVNGRVVDSQILRIDAGSTEHVSFTILKETVAFQNGKKQYFVTASTSLDEISLGNNDKGVFVVYYPESDIDTEILNYQLDHGKTHVNSVVKNNTYDEKMLNVLTAVYDHEKRLVGMDVSSFLLDSQDDIGVDAAVDWSIRAGDTIRVFVCGSDYAPLCPAPAVIVKEQP